MNDEPYSAPPGLYEKFSTTSPTTYPKVRAWTQQAEAAGIDGFFSVLSMTAFEFATQDAYKHLNSNVRYCNTAILNSIGPVVDAAPEPLVKADSREAWEGIRILCEQMERMHLELCDKWICQCIPSHRHSMFALNPGLSHAQDSPWRILYNPKVGESVWTEITLEPRLLSDDLSDHARLCEKFVSGIDSSKPLRLQEIIKEFDIPTVVERLTLALTLSYFYLHLGGSQWWPYLRTEAAMHFHIQGDEHSFATSRVVAFFPFSAPEPPTDDGMAEMVNATMPSLPVLGKTLVEIVTWRPCAWQDLQSRIRSLQEDGNFPSEIIKSVVDVCTKWTGLIVRERIDTQYAATIRTNERMRMYFTDQVIGKLQAHLKEGYGVDFVKHFAATEAPNGRQRQDAGRKKRSSRSSSTLILTKDSPRLEDIHQATARSHHRETGTLVSAAEEAIQARNDDTHNFEPVNKNLITASQRWTKQTEVLTQMVDEENERRIKVAVLDSGLHFHPDVAKSPAYYERYESHSWITGGEEPQSHEGDEDGHGTFVASVILDTASNCYVYSMQIFSSLATASAGASKDSHREQKKIIAKAIRYAVDVWKVDIISMSFGFTKQSQGIREAIEYAYSKNVLMLAAAGNDGGLRKLRFPASDMHVLCINANNGHGNKYSANPHARRYDNLSFLGCAVEGYASATASSDVRRPLRSGTSHATAIAAGTASNIMQIVEDCKLRFKKEGRKETYKKTMRQLRTKEGMETVLREIGNERDGYHVVEPWLLVQKGDKAWDVAIALSRWCNKDQEESSEDSADS